MTCNTFLCWATALLCLLLAQESSALPETDYGPILDLGYAKYQGVRYSSLGFNLFQGIPYAAPPVGNLRWRAPVPIEKYLNNHDKNVARNATHPGKICVQGATTWGSNTTINLPSQSEDCLVMDVYTPLLPRSKNLPIAVNIHGGGYITGYNLDNSHLSSYANGSLIIVNIQYRLGFYGFLGSNEIQKDGTANAGFLDQRAALEWIQRNAPAFGGDPKKVTIWGGSAGGGSVMAQMMLHGGEERPPFRAAAAEFPGFLPFKGPGIVNGQYQALLATTNCSTLQCLRDTPEPALDTATKNAYAIGWTQGRYGYGDFWVTPTVDGKAIKELPSDAFKNGHFSKVPLLTDHSSWEGEGFTNLSITTKADVQHNFERFWQIRNESFFKQLLSLYPPSTYDTTYFSNPTWKEVIAIFPSFAKVIGDQPWAQAAGIWGDVVIRCTSWVVATGSSGVGMPTWKMFVDAGYKLHGVSDSYIQGAPNSTGNPPLESAMKDYFVSFFVNADPNQPVPGVLAPASQQPHWPLYSSGGSQGAVLGVTDKTLDVIPDPEDSDKCRFYQKHNALIGV
ncbi:Alpha/Beta hydrolase protein [Cadophora sp. MPI-SDFR-AT-0126]|nr:Alpha/Beta hydrolase protein [Leotiomycetes sp. MPI-SDFR-AT-0126]